MKILAINNISFAKKAKKADTNNKHGFRMPRGAAYSELKDLNLKRSRTIPEIALAQANNEDVSQDIEKLILSRIQKAQKDAEAFCREHPEFSYDDVCQDLVIYVVKETKRAIKKRNNNIFGPGYEMERKRYFKRILKAQEKRLCGEEEYVSKNMPLFVPIEAGIYQEGIRQNLEEVLDPRELSIMLSRYGFEDRTKTLREIGAEHNLSKTRVAQIEETAKDKLKNAAENQELLSLDYPTE